MLTQLKSNPKVLLTLSIALAIVTIASASLVSRSSRQAFVSSRSAAAAFPTPCVDTFTVAGGPISTPTPTPTGTSTNPHANFRIKFQDINSDLPIIRRQQRQVRITLKPTTGSSIVQVRPVDLTSSDAIYEGSIDTTAIPAGTYTIYVKGFAHMQKLVDTQTFPLANNTTFNWTSQLLKAGDIFCGIPPVFGGTCSDTVFFDNYIELSDLSKAIQDYSLNVPSSSIADINLDGYVELSDLGRMIINYSLQPGDEW